MKGVLYGGITAHVLESNNLLFSMCFIFSFFDSYIIVFVDTVVMSKIAQSKRKINIGQQRMFAPIGFGASSLIVSALLKSFPKYVQLSQYVVGHFCYAALLILTLMNSHVFVKGVKVQKKKQDVKVLSQILMTIKRPRVYFSWVHSLFRVLVVCVK